MTIAPVNRLLLFLALSALVLKSEAKGLLKLSRSGDVLESLAFRTRSCDECGMTLFGTISVKVCGSVGCCYTPWMQGRFDEGGMDYMSGATIGECYQFLFREAGEAPLEVGDAVTDIRKAFLSIVYKMHVAFIIPGTCNTLGYIL